VSTVPLPTRTKVLGLGVPIAPFITTRKSVYAEEIELKVIEVVDQPTIVF
jgi:hypothetical protein